MLKDWCRHVDLEYIIKLIDCIKEIKDDSNSFLKNKISMLNSI